MTSSGSLAPEGQVSTEGVEHTTRVQPLSRGQEVLRRRRRLRLLRSCRGEKVKRVFVIAVPLSFVLGLLREPVSAVFAPLFRHAVGPVLFVMFFGAKMQLLPNEDPASMRKSDSVLVITGKEEIFGFMCDSGMAFQAMAVFLALWAATPLSRRRLATLGRGLILIYLFVLGRMALLVLETLANHECWSPDSHWAITRLEWVGRGLAVFNWEIAMDLVMALLGPFLIWAVVCGRDLFAHIGLFPSVGDTVRIGARPVSPPSSERRG